STFNCGTCGNTCHNGATCQAGVCACPDGRLQCNEFCQDISSDPANCGACNNACTPGDVCVNGHCQQDCAPGFTNCNGYGWALQPAGGKSAACGPTCANSVVSGRGNCPCPDSRATLCAGECVDLATDPAHCGDCMTACKAARICQRGQCVVNCAPGF